MKNIINKIIKFKYKTISALILLILIQIAKTFLFESDILSVFSLILFGYIAFVIFRLMFYGIKNTYYKDKSKTLAIIIGVIASVFTGFVIYLIVSNLL